MTFSSDLQEISREAVALAERCAREAGAYLTRAFRQRQTVESKLGYFDIVTEHDRRAEQMITERILAEMPGSRVVGEEDEPRGEGELTWYVDPIDGTSNFASGMPFYCVSIGIAYRGELIGGVVYDPERDELFAADLSRVVLNGETIRPSETEVEHDALYLVSWPHEGRSSRHDEAALFQGLLGSARAVRRMGSAALGLAWVAAGRADGASELIVKPWDAAAGFFLVRRAGGQVKLGEEDLTPFAESDSWFSPRYIALAPALADADTAFSAIIEG